jgi:hypothetical protein
MHRLALGICALALPASLLAAAPASADSDYPPDPPSVTVNHCSAFWGECDVDIAMPFFPGYPYPQPGSSPSDISTVQALLVINNTKRPLSKPLLPQQTHTYTVNVNGENPPIQLVLDAGTYSFTWQTRPDSSSSWSKPSTATEVKMGGIFGAVDPEDAIEGPLGTITLRGFQSGRVVTVTGQVRPADGVPHVGGDSVQVKYRFPGQTSYQDGGVAQLDRNGRFAWSIVTGRKIYVSVRAGDVKAPRLVIR